MLNSQKYIQLSVKYIEYSECITNILRSNRLIYSTLNQAVNEPLTFCKYFNIEIFYVIEA